MASFLLWLRPMNRHNGSCRKRMAVICHCLAPTLGTFYPCCGWYCTCKGRLNDKQLKKALEAAKQEKLDHSLDYFRTIRYVRKKING